MNGEGQTTGKGRWVRKGEFDLDDRLLAYATRILKLVESLPNSRAGNHIAGQLLRSGTSPLSNHGEAVSAESAKDFMHKMRVCLKELRESQRWLRLIKSAALIRPQKRIDPLLEETDELIRIFVSSIKTARSGKNGV